MTGKGVEGDATRSTPARLIAVLAESSARAGDGRKSKSRDETCFSPSSVSRLTRTSVRQQRRPWRPPAPATPSISVVCVWCGCPPLGSSCLEGRGNRLRCQVRSARSFKSSDQADAPSAYLVELAVGLTDDYGVDLMLDSLDCAFFSSPTHSSALIRPHTVQIEVLDADTLSAPIGVALQLDGASSFSSSPPKNIAFFTFNPSRGPFQILKLFLIFSPSASTCSIPSKLSFRLSVRPRPTSSPSSSRFDGSDCSTATRRIRQILGETEQEAVETWDEKSYVLMSLTSGAVEVRSEGKEVKVAGTKGALPTFPSTRLCK